MEKLMLNAIVTGGAGFIGSHLVDRLLNDNYDVTVIDNLERGDAENLKHIANLQMIREDLRHYRDQVAVDDDTVVFDLAAKVFGIRHLYAEPWTLMRDNVQITLNNLRRWSNVEKYVYVSSSCVYDWDNVPLPHTESDVGYLNSFYGWSKLIGEILCQAVDEECGFNYTIIRPFNVYGPRESFQYPHVVPDFIKQTYEHKRDGVKTFTILGDGRQTRSFTYVADVVDGIVKAAERGGKTAYNLSSVTAIQMKDLAAMIWRLFDIEFDPVYIPAPTQEVKRRCGTAVKAINELNWHPATPLTTGLQHTIDWYLHTRRAQR